MTTFDPAVLMASALAAQAKAYAPYSKFLVGAALLGESGETYAGCNVENLSFGLTNCAERVAVGNAITAGERKFVALAIASAGAVTPCGACRQVLAEFCEDLPIFLVDAREPTRTTRHSLAELLPGRFAGEFF